MRSILLYTFHRAGSNVVSDVLGDLCKAAQLPFHSPNDRRKYAAIHRERWQGYIARRRGCFGPIRVGEAHPCVPFDTAGYELIVHVRDPRDVLVSLYFAQLHVLPQIPDSEGMTEDRRALWQRRGLDAYVLAASELVRRRYQFAQECLVQQGATVIRYEEMVTAFPAWLGRLLSCFAEEVPASRLAGIKQRLARRWEPEFQVRGEDVASHKRQVTPGDHRRKLRPETVRALDAGLRDVLDAFGYSHGKRRA
jgi:hypothetical protein